MREFALLVACLCSYVVLGTARLLEHDQTRSRFLQEDIDGVGQCIFGDLASPYRATRNATCEIYPSDGVCAHYLAGRSYYRFNDVTFEDYEKIALTLLLDAQLILNFGATEQDCYEEAVKTGCMKLYLDCQMVGDEPVPALPCLSTCEDYWRKCELVNILYYTAVLGQNPAASKISTCGISNSIGATTWNNDGVFDRFNEREVPGLFLWPEGYNGELHNPNISAAYNLSNGTVIDVPCWELPTTPFVETLLLTECKAPLERAGGANSSCGFACPFFLFSDDEYAGMYWAHVVPMIPGFLACLYVFVDSVEFMFGQRGAALLRNIMRSIKAAIWGSTNDSEDHHEKKQRELKTAILYAFVGSIFGLIYYLCGPLVVAIASYEYQLGCPVGQTNLLVTTLLVSTSTDKFGCAVNRYSIFLLMFVVNAIVFSICRIHMVVTRSIRMNKISNRRKLVLNSLLVAYCGLVPIICAVVASQLDDPGFGTDRILVSYNRFSIVCGPRLSDTEEFGLIFVPMLSSVFILIAVSLDITRITYKYQRDSGSNSGRKGSLINVKESKPRNRSLERFQRRLVILSIFAAVLMILYVTATVLTLPKFQSFGSKLAEFIRCSTLENVCEQENCAFPDDSEGRPDPALIALQFAALSSMPALFGIFFTLTALDRRQRTSRTGSKASTNAKHVDSKDVFPSKMLTAQTLESSRSNELPPIPGGDEEIPAAPKVGERKYSI